MKQDDFLAEFFGKNDRVSVNARELQSLIKTKLALEKEVVKSLNKEMILQNKVHSLEAKCEILEMETLRIDLKG